MVDQLINGDERAFVYIILIGKEPVRCVAEIKLFIAGRLQLHLLCILAHGDGNEFEGCVNLLLHDGTCLAKYFFVVVVGVAQGIPDQIHLFQFRRSRLAVLGATVCLGAILLGAVGLRAVLLRLFAARGKRDQKQDDCHAQGQLFPFHFWYPPFIQCYMIKGFPFIFL